MKKCVSAVLCIALALFICTHATAATPDELWLAAESLREQGIMVGDQTGSLHLDDSLTRAELAAILCRLRVNQEHIAAEEALYTRYCTFPDVPEWARVYVGYCAFNGLMVGYDTGAFGASDSVTPAAACTVVLRHLGISGWDYETACQTALDLNLTTPAAVAAESVTRGDIAVMLYRALNTAPSDTEFPQDTDSSEGAAVSRNADGSINIPSDRSRYIPQAGDVIRCDDGTNYLISDVDRWDNNLFASGPAGSLPEPTCDWSQFPGQELPAVQVRRYQSETGDRLHVLNLYETRRMLYTLYNTAPSCPEVWENRALKLNAEGIPILRLTMGISESNSVQVFWPWQEEQLTKVFKSAPMARFEVEAWDVYKDGVFQRTEYNIRAT